MARRQMDIKLTDGLDLEAVGGDWVSAESTVEHQRQLVINAKGDYKQSPTICADAFNYIDDTGTGGLARAIAVEYTRDGMKVDAVRVGKDLKINATAEY